MGESLFIPRQTSKSDSCVMDDDFSISDFFTQNPICCWIHTHPQHGQMLSSIDLHMQYNLQNTSTSDNILAIVYSPENKVQLRGYKLNT